MITSLVSRSQLWTLYTPSIVAVGNAPAVVNVTTCAWCADPAPQPASSAVRATVMTTLRIRVVVVVDAPRRMSAGLTATMPRLAA